MNKELIEQLEGVGFIRSGHLLFINIKSHSLFYNCTSGLLAEEFNASKPIKRLGAFFAFPEIIAAIKEHTGVDLTKKTKRAEIKELKTKVASLEDSISKISLSHQSDSDKFRVKLKSLQDAIESQNELIELNKQASEMQAEGRKGFKVGDFVVLSKDLLKQNITEEVIEAVNLQTVFEVLRIENNVYFLDKKLHKGESWTMEERDLEHAPAESPKEKALEFGDPLECKVNYDGLVKGEKVVFLSSENNGEAYNVIDKHSNHYCLGSCFFKPL